MFPVGNDVLEKVQVVTLVGIIAVDSDDQTYGDFTLYFANVDVASSLAAAGAAFAGLSDAHAQAIVGRHFLDDSATQVDFTGSKIWFEQGLDIQMPAAINSESLYVFGVVDGTPTTTASGLQLRFLFDTVP